jgi:ABC-type branched-subunit amino acid transport system substrate-binding protein
MNEIKFGQTAYASGGTMDFDEILKFISKNTKNVLINIIITDAGFNVNETEVKNFLKKEVDGLVIFITNCENAQVKKIANENEFKTKLIYILADANFNIE